MIKIHKQITIQVLLVLHVRVSTRLDQLPSLLLESVTSLYVVNGNSGSKRLSQLTGDQNDPSMAPPSTKVVNTQPRSIFEPDFIFCGFV